MTTDTSPALQTAAHIRLPLTARAADPRDRCPNHAHGLASGAVRPRRSPSKRRAQAQCRVARLYRDIRSARSTRTHQLTRRLVDLGVVLVLEDLNVRGMTRKGGAGKRGLNRRIADAAFADLRRRLGYKLPPGRLIIADRWYPSSKLCSTCQVKNHDLTLAMRTWTCTTCGTRHDRDVNAAANLAAWGEQHLTDIGQRAGSQAGDRNWPGPSETTSTPGSSHARREAYHPHTTTGVRGLDETGTQHPLTRSAA